MGTLSPEQRAQAEQEGRVLAQAARDLIWPVEMANADAAVRGTMVALLIACHAEELEALVDVSRASFRDALLRRFHAALSDTARRMERT